LATRGPRLTRWLIALIILATALVFTHVWWLTALGSFLIKAQPPERADIAVVLAGDPSGNRIIRAAQLVREGFVPKVLVSGPDGMYGFYESELAIRFAVNNGFPSSYFEAVPNQSRSTRQEALDIVTRLRQLGVRRVDLVTSDYHTRRAGGIYRRTAPEIQFTVVAAPDKAFQAHTWWRSREGRKMFLMEWLKTLTDPFGL
jgi:uncharacterized SAM-binding protein YcdF (DUF218 family)